MNKPSWRPCVTLLGETLGFPTFTKGVRNACSNCVGGVTSAQPANLTLRSICGTHAPSSSVLPLYKYTQCHTQTNTTKLPYPGPSAMIIEHVNNLRSKKDKPYTPDFFEEHAGGILAAEPGCGCLGDGVDSLRGSHGVYRGPRVPPAAAILIKGRGEAVRWQGKYHSTCVF
ncbi:hypothetical protein Bbelb_172520 [Branchiostoma belcheri]|nr:hypothetical protein Bbelb_172520 [Branchiostoma belcheri]